MLQFKPQLKGFVDGQDACEIIVGEQLAHLIGEQHEIPAIRNVIDEKNFPTSGRRIDELLKRAFRSETCVSRIVWQI